MRPSRHKPLLALYRPFSERSDISTQRQISRAIQTRRETGLSGVFRVRGTISRFMRCKPSVGHEKWQNGVLSRA
jgi:hypothetical protein